MWTASFNTPDVLTSKKAIRGQNNIAAARLDTSLRERLSVQNRWIRQNHPALRIARTPSIRKTNEANISLTLKTPRKRGMHAIKKHTAARKTAINDRVRRTMVMK
ncbi:MAG: hypothetical protein Q8N35_00790 [Methylococcaceae bacterium]|nr:hypothetical protein [Methylococcaceae bacterium]MDP2393912.1 hypothetical protein [Methylococcaceae bacterium]MDP3018100.1 hypothetical protein [Methylococcaceae bacterium]MDP3391789.1 hypothetical protein [Methylococcaceae bacterium]MDZ4155300.1 hypothetical protein [Methylococcales bacterium]